MTTKRCSRCGLEKPLADFYRDARHRHGRYSACKTCHIETVKHARLTQREQAAS